MPRFTKEILSKLAEKTGLHVAGGMRKIVRVLVWLIRADVSGQLDQASLYTQQQVAWILSTQPTNVC